MTQAEPLPANDSAYLLRWMLGIGASIIVAGIVATIGVGWGMNSQLASLTTSMATVKEDLRTVSLQLSAASSDRYTGSQAANDRSSVMTIIDKLIVVADRNRERISSLEHQVNSIERALEKVKP